jgi:N-glycosylase/DNA lyase
VTFLTTIRRAISFTFTKENAVKLAQALNLRKKLVGDISNLSQLIMRTAFEQPGDESRDPNKAVAALAKAHGQLEYLTVAINTANNSSQIDYKGKRVFLSDIRLFRDQAALKQQSLQTILTQHLQYMPRLQDERGRSIQPRILLDTKSLSEQVNQAARDWRELDDILQQANWQVDVNFE